jgi:ribosome-binding factor A
MSRRTEKVASTIRQVLSQAIASKLSDPRISPLASITRVEVSGDLMHATVYVSVMGGDAAERRMMAGLQRARGYLQSLLAKTLTTRHCPQLRFTVDKGLKKQMETLELLDQISAELRESDVEGGLSSNDQASHASNEDAGVAGQRRDVKTSPGGSP